MEIMDALHSLGSSHKFLTDGQQYALVAYDVMCVEPMDDMLLACYTEIIDTQLGHKLSFDHSFILRLRDHNAGDRWVQA
jgi:hypothetical protein